MHCIFYSMYPQDQERHAGLPHRHIAFLNLSLRNQLPDDMGFDGNAHPLASSATVPNVVKIAKAYGFYFLVRLTCREMKSRALLVFARLCL